MTRALVVYESMYGNTQRVAQAIADGLSMHLRVGISEVATAPARLPPDVGLLVVGGPTHAFGMTRPNTRADAAKRVEFPVVSQGQGQREWLEHVLVDPLSLVAATFDTKVGRPRFFWGSAAKRARAPARPGDRGDRREGLLRRLRTAGGRAAARRAGAGSRLGRSAGHGLHRAARGVRLARRAGALISASRAAGP